MSTAMARATCPAALISAAAALALSASISATTIRAPTDENSRAISRPIPRPAPEMIATRLANVIVWIVPLAIHVSPSSFARTSS